MGFTTNPASQVNQLPISVELSDNPQTSQEILVAYLRRIANILNTKTGGLYSLVETINSDQYYTSNTAEQAPIFRSVYRTLYDMVALNAGVPILPAQTVSFPHNITGLMFSALIYASCTSSTKLFTVMGYNDVYLTTTNVVFTNNSGLTLTAVTVDAEYLKN